jgi:hypothetical protein
MEVVISKTFDELVRDLGLTIESLRDDVESLKGLLFNNDNLKAWCIEGFSQ